MAYTVINFASKKSLKEALSNGEEVRVYQPGPFGSSVGNGDCYLEGPHYPKPHKWYAKCQVEDGKIVPGTVR